MELFNPSIDLTIDYSELFLDDFLDNEVVNKIPIIKTFVGVIKTGVVINQLWFAKKLLTFISEFNKGSIDSKKLVDFKNRFDKDEKYRKKLVEIIMVINDKFLEIEKSKISAQLFKSYVEEKIDYEEFVSLNISLDRIHPESYKFLQILEKSDFKISEEIKSEKSFDEQALLLSTGLARETSSWSHGFVLCENGRKLYEHGIKKIIRE